MTTTVERNAITKRAYADFLRNRETIGDVVSACGHVNGLMRAAGQPLLSKGERQRIELGERELGPVRLGVSDPQHRFGKPTARVRVAY